MAFFDHRALAEAFSGAINSLNRSRFGELVTEDFVNDWPQSGERVRGVNNFWATITNYPKAGAEGLRNDPASVQTQSAAAIKLLAPSYTFVAVEGAGSTGTFTLKVRYPDGSDWWVITLYRLRDGRIYQASTFFAPVYPAPPWRAQWVEAIG